MPLRDYFATDDGTLPEIEVTFRDPSQMVPAVAHLLACGGRDVTRNGGCVEMRETGVTRPFAGAQDAALLAAGAADPFHVLLADIRSDGEPLPDLGVLVSTHTLTLDYRIGADWGAPQIRSFISLLRQLQAFGGIVSVPWWGQDGERAFRSALEGDLTSAFLEGP